MLLDVFSVLGFGVFDWGQYLQFNYVVFVFNSIIFAISL